MEHRLYKRALVDHLVRIIYQEEVVAIAHAFDISSIGLGVWYRGITLPKGRNVIVDFTEVDKPSRKECCVRAMIIHVDRSSMGFMFTKAISPEEFVDRCDYVPEGYSYSYKQMVS